ncbi:MAG: flagellar motor switch protein FliN, partial [Leptospiraceae bacterium]|nr:flagellar motor switch protein FliN [Leptospiraceae bacterium]
MGEGSLSQDEIDALLQGADETSFDTSGSAVATGGGGSDALSPVDRDIIAELIGSAFSMAGNTLGTILSKNVRISSPNSETKTPAELKAELGSNSICMYSDLSGSFSGRVAFIMSIDNASKIINVMMGGMSTGEMDEAQIQTLKDSLSPIIGTVTAQTGLKLNASVNGTPANISVVKTPSDLILPDGATLIRTSLNVSIDGIPSFKVHYLLSLSTANDMLTISKRGGVNKQQDSGTGGMNINMNPGAGQSLSQLGIKSVGFPSLSTAGSPSGATNLNLLMDVQMALTVELGRTKMYIKDILGLGEGSIIELDKLAGEPVDLLVNGKLIAKGEVVVIDENFGVRVTDIVSPTDRIKGEN